jgi:hypothetical protein
MHSVPAGLIKASQLFKRLISQNHVTDSCRKASFDIKKNIDTAESFSIIYIVEDIS